MYSSVESALGCNGDPLLQLYVPPLSGLLVYERRRVDEEEEGLRDERLFEVETDLEMRLEEQLLPHVGDRRRSPVTGSRRRRFVVMVVVEAAGADLSPHSVRILQLGRCEEVEKAVPLGPLGDHISVAASLSNYKTIVRYEK